MPQSKFDEVQERLDECVEDYALALILASLASVALDIRIAVRGKAETSSVQFTALPRGRTTGGTPNGQSLLANALHAFQYGLGVSGKMASFEQC